MSPGLQVAIAGGLVRLLMAAASAYDLPIVEGEVETVVTTALLLLAGIWTVVQKIRAERKLKKAEGWF
jgi:hypothetical protein